MALSARPWSAVGGLAVVLVAAGGALVMAGVPADDVLRWLAVVLLGVLAPGLVAVRALRGPGALSEDLAWAVPVGLLLALTTWALGLAVGLPVSPWWTGVAATAVLLVPRVRRRVVDPGEPGWGRGSGALVLGSLVVATAWAAGSLLASIPVTADRPFRWSPDTMFHTALAGEMARTAAPQYPMVPEGPYPYHWFFHALAAHLGRNFEPLVVVTHLLPLTLLLGVVAMAAVAGRLVAGHRWGAGVGAAAIGLVGITQPSAWVISSGTGRADADGAGFDPIHLYWQPSATTTLGWLAALGVVAAATPFLRPGPAHRRDVVLVLLMGVLAAGAKAAQTPVLLCGFAAVIGWALIRRRWSLARRGGLLAAALALPCAIALVTMYAGGAHGLVLDPGERAVGLAVRLTPALSPVGPDGDRATTPIVLTTAVSLWLLPLVPRLLGLLWWVRRPLDPVGLLCGATVVAGLGGTFLTDHPGGSEAYFLICAYPVGVVGSAAGLVLATVRLRERWGGRRLLVVGTSAAVAGAAATALLARWAGTRSPLATWRASRPDEVPGAWLSEREQLLAWSAPTIALLVLFGVVTVLAVVLGGRPSTEGMRRRAAGVLVVAVLALAGGGLVSTVRDVLSGRGEDVAARIDAPLAGDSATTRVLVTPALWEAADLVRRSGSVDDVVVTNRACAQTAPVLERQSCDPREFAVAALTGRRTGVSGWAYAPESMARARDVVGGYARMPFWDPARLAEQRALVEQPTRERAAAAWARGERWILADRAAGPVSDDLATVGEVLLDRDGVVLVRLSPPAA